MGFDLPGCFVRAKIIGKLVPGGVGTPRGGPISVTDDMTVKPAEHRVASPADVGYATLIENLINARLGRRLVQDLVRVNGKGPSQLR